MNATVTERAIGIVRVSQTKGREGESFASPVEQREQINAACEARNLGLVDLFDELDVSGGTPLVKRTGMREAVEAIEAGQADVIVAAYFDRLFRSLEVQAEISRRVEQAGGKILALDTGEVSTRSAGEWLNATMRGMMAEYQRRTTRDRSGEAQARAIARGVAPWPNVTAGYVRGDDGVFLPDPQRAPTVAEAFQMRADGATLKDVRAYLNANDIPLSYHGVETLLKSRIVLGEIHFGKLVNLDAHEPIVDRELWQQVQRMKVSRGRRAKSDRLLARLGVLRCGTCGARMVVGSAHHGQYRLYRCVPTSDCARRVTVSAELVEQVVTDAVRTALADAHGRASAEASAHGAEVALERAQASLDAAIRTFAGLEDEDAARERLAELRGARDAARARVEQLGGDRAAVVVNGARDWELLTLAERRALVRAVVERVTVAPGRGSDRITVELVSE